MHRDKGIGAWNSLCLLFCPWFAGSFYPVGSFDKPIVRHEEKVEYSYRLQILVLPVEELVGLDRGYDLRFVFRAIRMIVFIWKGTRLAGDTRSASYIGY